MNMQEKQALAQELMGVSAMVQTATMVAKTAEGMASPGMGPSDPFTIVGMVPVAIALT